jgi:hypothetical protein
VTITERIAAPAATVAAAEATGDFCPLFDALYTLLREAEQGAGRAAFGEPWPVEGMLDWLELGFLLGAAYAGGTPITGDLLKAMQTAIRVPESSWPAVADA